MPKLCLVIIAAALFIGCSPARKTTVEHKVLFVTGCSANKLEVLDWDGKGAPVIFLAGLGNTAHVFDHFALRFTDRYHVYGLTRRGFGKSDQPAADYTEKNLAGDILAVLDSLHIDKAILIGHSIAGEEISKFAATYPARVRKVVYLDAAYDRKTPGFADMQKIPIQNPVPTRQDSSSFAHWKDFSRKAYGLSFPDEELQQISIFSEKGSYLREVTSTPIYEAIFGALEHPDYRHITCPALGIYADFKSVNKAVPSYAELDAANQKNADQFFRLLQKYAITEQIRFKNELRNGIVKTVDHTNHYLFISNPAETEKLIRDFLR